MLRAEELPFLWWHSWLEKFPRADGMPMINIKMDTNQNSTLSLITYKTQAQLSSHIKFLLPHLNINYFIYAT